MLGVFWKIREIGSKTSTRISKIDGEMSEIMEPKVGNPWNSVSRNWAILSHPWNLTFLEDEIFNFVLTYMVQKYQNEISPIVYYGKKLKTSGKLLKIPDLQPRDWGQPYWMTRYVLYPKVEEHKSTIRYILTRKVSQEVDQGLMSDGIFIFIMLGIITSWVRLITGFAHS